MKTIAIIPESAEIDSYIKELGCVLSDAFLFSPFGEKEIKLSLNRKNRELFYENDGLHTLFFQSAVIAFNMKNSFATTMYMERDGQFFKLERAAFDPSMN